MLMAPFVRMHMQPPWHVCACAHKGTCPSLSHRAAIPERLATPALVCDKIDKMSYMMQFHFNSHLEIN